MRVTGFALVWLAVSLCAAPAEASDALRYASGTVFHDRNGDGEQQWYERGIGNVVVSNGRDVALTDRRGRYRVPVSDDTIVFVAKPSGWTTRLDANGIARSYYIHKPNGSPAELAFPGVAPTGPLPERIDFPLRRQHEPDRFDVLVFGDTQTYTREQIDHLARDVVEDLIDSDAAFGITLGDLVGDDLSLFEPLNDVIGRVGIPWYHVLGNHDLNFRAADDRHSDESYERVYGPATYAFAYGPVHFIVLDDVVYTGWIAAEDRLGPYAGGLSADQLDFVRNYLATVDRDQLVVLAMHIPFDNPPHEVPQRAQLFEILRDRPHTLSLAAHTHFQQHQFFGPAEGFEGRRPHHQLVAATAAGSWWLGARDEVGLPHATMRCGAPNGYNVVRFDGNRFSIHFRAARRPADYQMNVYAPETVPSAAARETEVLVNVFGGSERTVVEMRLEAAGSDTDSAAHEEPGWTFLQRTPREDPYYAAAVERDRVREPRPRNYLPPAIPSPHLWVGVLPADPAPGLRTLTVRATDESGQVFRARRLIRVE